LKEAFLRIFKNFEKGFANFEKGFANFEKGFAAISINSIFSPSREKIFQLFILHYSSFIIKKTHPRGEPRG